MHDTGDLVRLDGVSMKYRLARQRRPSFKQYALHWVLGALVYEDLWALSDVSLRIGRGESIGIIGRNGAGKSTLLKVISRVLAPTSGDLAVRGRVVPVLDFGAGLDTELSGLENIYLNAMFLGRTRAEVHAARDAIVAASGLGEFVDSPLRNYSAGMVARLGFSVATAWRPDVLILDEVLAVGDAGFVASCHARLQQFRDDGVTVLVVSHAPQEIQATCRRSIWIEGGRIRADGPTDSVLAAYAEFVETQRAEIGAPDRHA
jgi:ABC-type polysaccharide/polyol phosphate transport system ATPase subunit